MLKTRVIGVVLVKSGIAVQSVGFNRYLPVGRPEIAIEYLDRWGIDEIVVLHMGAANAGCALDREVVASYSRHCRVPLAVGGGLATSGDIKRVIQAGADKVVLNRAVADTPSLISDAAALFGSQCVVVSIDARREGASHGAYTDSGRTPTGRTAEAFAIQAAEMGAGEILLNSIDQDGMRAGYDLDLVSRVASAVQIPVIACGGAGHPEHFRAAMRRGASAVAAANFFHYTEHSVTIVKRYLTQQQEAVRLDSYADYSHHTVGPSGRLGKQSDDALDELRFRYVPEEVI
jgi:imidazole glycerol-phosphate synthase subunit HisF